MRLEGENGNSGLMARSTQGSDKSSEGTIEGATTARKSQTIGYYMPWGNPAEDGDKHKFPRHDAQAFDATTPGRPVLAKYLVRD